jgi:hypothetical protein
LVLGAVVGHITDLEATDLEAIVGRRANPGIGAQPSPRIMPVRVPDDAMSLNGPYMVAAVANWLNAGNDPRRRIRKASADEAR